MQRLQELLNGEFPDVVRTMHFVNFGDGEPLFISNTIDMRAFSRISVEGCKRLFDRLRNLADLKMVNVLNIHMQFILVLVNALPRLQQLELTPDTSTVVEIEEDGKVEYVPGNITIKTVETTFKLVTHKILVIYHARKTYTWVFGETRKERKLRLRCEAMLMELKSGVVFADVEKLHQQLCRIAKK